MDEFLERMKKRIISEEGLELKAQKNTLGIYKIGVGRDISERGINIKEAMFLLNNDITSVIIDLKQNIKNFVLYDDNIKEVLINMCFNIGIKKLLQFENMLNALESNNLKLAATELMNSSYANQLKEKASKNSELLLSIA